MDKKQTKQNKQKQQSCVFIIKVLRIIRCVWMGINSTVTPDTLFYIDENGIKTIVDM